MEPNPGYTVNMPWMKRTCRKWWDVGGVEAEWVTESETFYQSCEMVSRGTGRGSPRGFLWAPALLLEGGRAWGVFRNGLSPCFFLSKVSDAAQRELLLL